MFTRRKILTTAIVIELIATILLSYCYLAGSEFISHATNWIKTNNNNVDYYAYFIDENEQKVGKKVKSIKENDILYIDIAVKNDGYFNGKIVVENANFKLKTDKLTSNIDYISGNEIYLKQINAGKTETVQVKIEPIVENVITSTMLNTVSTIKLDGNYTNSKNIENNKSSKITGSENVEIQWKASNEIKIDLNSQIITNHIYKMKNEEKKIVQLQVNSGVTDNEYPIKNTNLKIQVPSEAKDIQVFARKTDSTNSGVKFNESNYKIKNNEIEINIDNNDDKKIYWNKENIDIFIITCSFDKNTNIDNLLFNVIDKITLYDNKELNQTLQTKIDSTDIDGTITSEIKLNEKTMYKGKIYTNENREYYTENNININYYDAIDKLILKTDESKLRTIEKDSNTNIVYKATLINKEKFEDIFGSNGFINVKNQQGEVISSINNNTEIDENGNYILNFINEYKSITFETSKPIKNGTISIITKKQIQNSNLSREEINKLVEIKEKNQISYNDIFTKNIENNIELKNTTSKARLEVNTDTLSANETNKNVKLTVTLENTDESKDVYKNPEIKLIFPKQVSNISGKCKVIYGNGLVISDPKLYKENENHVIKINLLGEQATYNTNLVQGTTVVIYADIDILEDAKYSDEKIILNYTNEFAQTLDNNGIEESSIKIEPLSDKLKQLKNNSEIVSTLAQNNDQQSLNVNLKAFVGNTELNEGDIVYRGEVIRYEASIVNTGNQALENINILAQIPNGTKYVEYVPETQEMNITEEYSEVSDSYKDRYEEKALENNLINKTIDKLNVGENDKYILKYEVKVDDNTEINGVQNKVTISYNNKTEEKTINNIIQDSPVEARVFMSNRFIDGVFVGNNYNYILSVKNKTNEVLENANIQINTNKNLKVGNVIRFKDNSTEIVDFTDNKITESINPGETKEYYVEVEVNKETDNKTGIFAMVNNKFRSNLREEIIKTSSIKVNMTSVNAGEKVGSGENIVYDLTVENNGDVDQNLFCISQTIPSYLEINKIIANNTEIQFSEDHKIETDIIENTSEEDDEEYIEDNINSNYKIGYEYSNLLKPTEKLNIQIHTKVKELEENSEYNVSSISKVNNVDSEEVVHILGHSNYGENIYDETADEVEPENPEEDDEEDDENEEEGDNNENDNKEEKNQDEENHDNIEENKNLITGTVWLDENENGKRDTGEKTVDGVNVKLLNTNNGNIIETNNQDGVYAFTEVDNGKYIIIFEYDKNKYNLTTYQANDVSLNLNSDVENNKITINNKEQILATTDIITINNNNALDIDLGLINKKVFDLELTKTISKITVSNSEGKKITEYKDADLAKIEIASKYLKGSTVVIEYKIKVTNNGDIAGFAKKIVDYKPNDLEFNSSINSNWYQSGDYIYSNSLENEIINPGETKEIKLILTKKMTQSNTGLSNNIAEIQNAYNSSNIKDVDSIVNNKQFGEDDLGQANVIISIKTGALVTYTITVITITLIACTIIYFVFEKRK